MQISKRLPNRLKLFNFAKKELVFSGEYLIADFPEVSRIASNISDTLKADLSFTVENGRTPCVEGVIKSAIMLPCQRCLEELTIDLEINFNLAFVQNEQQGVALDSRFELYITKDEELSTIDLISDEVLLSIPMVPLHDYDCETISKKQKLVEQKRENPFSILKNIQMAGDGKE